MTKQEFQKRIGAEISQKDYSIVEHVYTWHPSISEVEGKEQIAELSDKNVSDYVIYGKFTTSNMHIKGKWSVTFPLEKVR